jgi:hypothetical protein
MRELLRSTDPVRLSWLTALLADAGVEAVVFDLHTSILEGSIGAIPRRLVVAEEDYGRAVRILRESGEGDGLGEGAGEPW